MAWRRRNIPILVCLFWFVAEKTRTIDLCSDLFLKNGSRKTNEILKKCRIDTIGQESENRKTNLESEESESGNWIMDHNNFFAILRFGTYLALSWIAPSTVGG